MKLVYSLEGTNADSTRYYHQIRHLLGADRAAEGVTVGAGRSSETAVSVVG